ncbi:MAG TPA: hypothetical protein VN848_07425 [Gemmatimonadales bacterium]|nr:hypothetical protein [Gemmatimonadales bacterium]
MNARVFRFSVLAALLAACTGGGAQKTPAKATLVIGLDVSGSFKNEYDDAVAFASYYIYAHLHGLGGLHQPTALFVASIGGDRPGEPKAFHPIDDFSNRTQEEIASDLRTWFPPRDAYTDFNVFFRQVASLAKERGLILAPLTLVILSDGVPDVGAQAHGGNPIARIDFSPLEYLSRSVTVRLLYASPTVGDEWKRLVHRKRVRLWTEEAPVMVGWHRQLADSQPVEQQDSLFKWMADNVDFRVRTGAIF